MSIKIFSAIVKGLTNREVKQETRASKSQLITMSGQYYNGTDIVSVAGYESPKIVNDSLAVLNDKYKDVVPKFPSKNEPPFDPVASDLAAAGKSTMLVNSD